MESPIPLAATPSSSKSTTDNTSSSPFTSTRSSQRFSSSIDGSFSIRTINESQGGNSFGNGLAMGSVNTPLTLVQLALPPSSYELKPSKPIIVNLTLQPNIIITCSTPSGHELGYFGWNPAAVSVHFEDRMNEVVIRYASEPSIWSSGQRVPETKEYLPERGWFHTLVNVVGRGGVADEGGVLRLRLGGGGGGGGAGGTREGVDAYGGGIDRVADATGAGLDVEELTLADSQGRDTYSATPTNLGGSAGFTSFQSDEDYDIDYDEDGEVIVGSPISPSRTSSPKTPGSQGRDRQRMVLNGKINKTGKSRNGSISGASGPVNTKKLLNNFARLTI